MPRTGALVVALVLTAVACGTSEEPTSTSESSSVTTTASPTTSVTVPDTTTVATAASMTTGPVATVPGTTTTTLAGEPVAGFAVGGDQLMVVGVSHDDVLNVRAGPGIAYEIVTTIDPEGTVTATGEARDLGRSIWYRVGVGGTTGWVNASFLAFGGATGDVTAVVVETLGEYPTAATLEELGRIVAGTHAVADPESSVVLSVAPSVGDLGEVAYDVIGLGDDSIYGYRLRVFADPVGDGFSLHTVERTDLCGRGVDLAGVCA
jgi:Bacterial SH3 domain